MNPTTLKAITTLRHELHQYPELSNREIETSRRLRRFLQEKTTLEVVVKMDGWFYAVKEGTDPEAGSIAFRADMDALPINEGLDLPYASVHPGTAHKCGHDGHCAALCGLALELDKLQTKRTVYLIFQKAEETGDGGQCASKLIREKGICEVYAFHNLSGYPEGAVVYRKGLTQPASEGLRISFTGKRSHASAPEDGRNPAEAIAKTVLYIQKLQKEPHRGMVLCTITGMEAGSGDFGISAGEGSLSVTLRAEEEEELLALEEKICVFAREEASSQGIRTKWQIYDRFPETRNSTQGIKNVLCAAESFHIPVMEMPEIWRASEDFGHYLKKCPGAMFYIGSGENWPALHTEEYDFNDRILETAVDMFLTMVKNHL